MHLLGAFWVVGWWVQAGGMGEEGGENFDSQVEILGIVFWDKVLRVLEGLESHHAV